MNHLARSGTALRASLHTSLIPLIELFFLLEGCLRSIPVVIERLERPPVLDGLAGPPDAILLVRRDPADDEERSSVHYDKVFDLIRCRVKFITQEVQNELGVLVW